MNVDSREISLIRGFLKLQNEDVIEYFEKELLPKKIEELCDEIDLSLEDSANGKVISIKTLKEQVMQWC